MNESRVNEVASQIRRARRRWDAEEITEREYSNRIVLSLLRAGPETWMPVLCRVDLDTSKALRNYCGELTPGDSVRIARCLVAGEPRPEDMVEMERIQAELQTLAGIIADLETGDIIPESAAVDAARSLLADLQIEFAELADVALVSARIRFRAVGVEKNSAYKVTFESPTDTVSVIVDAVTADAHVFHQL